MAHSYLPVDRDQQLLLPPNMSDWLPKEHLVWFVIDLVKKVSTSELHRRHPNDGVGRRAYDPEMLLGLLIYSYCTGVRSSREIERLCWSDVAFRVLSANLFPDHATLCRFRKDFQDLARKLFVDVLSLAKEAGAMKVGVVALDGTKMYANASMKANRPRQRLEAERQALEKLVEEMLAEADQIDHDQDNLFGKARGDELPSELADAAARKSRLDAAAEVLERREKEAVTETEKRRANDRVARAKAAEEAGRKRLDNQMAREKDLARRRSDEGLTTPPGTASLHPEGSSSLRRAKQAYEHNLARLQRAEEFAASLSKPCSGVNLTDPDSRMMHSTKGALQGYNAQAAVNEEGIVVAALVGNDPTDHDLFVPVLDTLRQNLFQTKIEEPIGTALADAGYLSEHNLKAPGPDRLIAIGKSREMAKQPPVTEPLAEGAGVVEANEHRLRTPEGKALYSKRMHMIEPVFGHTKHNRGFRSFLLRGVDAVNAEWNLMMTAHNITKLFKMKMATAEIS